jgi:hypothetical protein
MGNFNPQTIPQTEGQIRRQQGAGYADTFAAGMFDDLPVTPANGVKYLENYISFGDRLVPRGGCRIWTNTALPALRTGYTASSAITGTNERTITVTCGDFTSADLGRYFINDSGQHERITTVENTSVIKTFAPDKFSTDNDWSCTAGWVRGKINCQYFHKLLKKIIIQIDTRVFVATTLTIDAWQQAFCVSYDAPSDSISRADEYQNSVFLFNSNGIFKIDLSNSNYTFYKVNSPTPSVRISDQNISAQGVIATSCPYGRRYVVSMSRISGTGLRDRQTPGAAVLHETGTTALSSDDSSGASGSLRDFGSVFKSMPFGLGDTTYGVLTGASLDYSPLSSWKAITDGEFQITINGTLVNVFADFSGIKSMADIATVIQAAMRINSGFALVTCTYVVSGGQSHFVITSPTESGTVSYTTTGVSGTDISSVLKMESGSLGGDATTSASTTPTYSSPGYIATLQPPKDPVDSTVQFHDDFYSVYATLDVGPNGIDPINGVGNNPDIFVWLADIPIARAFTAAKATTGTYLTGILTLDSGQLFQAADIGCGVVFQDASSAVIHYLCDAGGTVVNTATSRYALATGVTGASGAQSCCIGGGAAFTASQAVSGGEILGRATVTIASGYTLTSADVGKPIFWADGTKSEIVKYLSASTAEVVAAGIKASQAATINPTSRVFADTVSDYNLRSRIARYSLKQRFWQPIPASNLGVISAGFLFAAAQNDTYVYYGQLSQYYEFFAGSYNPAFQYALIKDAVQELLTFPDQVVVFGSHSTSGITTSSYQDQKLSDVGEDVVVLTTQKVLDPVIGTSCGSVIMLDRSRALGITTEPAIRTFDGQQYSADLAEGKIGKKLRKLQAAYAVAYDAYNGFMFWGLDA